jgi:hypothetical protein
MYDIRRREEEEEAERVRGLERWVHERYGS